MISKRTYQKPSKEEICPKDMSRESIRKRLLRLNHVNLFRRVSRLLLHLVTSYRLYDVTHLIRNQLFDTETFFFTPE